ncbi:hypothetical protein BJ742DRAFT_676632 [Cladochytrium replicatum]|nr:hypothetical protein BJ742DRAFT_676632 [Cladochytrium replicatum]
MRDQGWFDESGRIRRTHPMDKWMSGEKDWVAVCAPMVRYSKLPFRQLVRDYNVDIAYTPMILSDVFKYSAVSRSVDFTTCFSDDPVVVQFAANNAIDLGDASELVAPFVNGVDLNCGCPQKWALHEKIGAHLLEHPDLVADMVSQTKSRTSGVLFPTSPSQRRSLNSKYGDQSFPVSVKIRIDVSGDLKKTVEFARRAEKVGADWVTVHGRTRKQKSTEPVDLVAIKLVKESLSIPVFANGDVFSRADADRIAEYTGTDGIMAARGLLENPALFAGDLHTPPEAIRKFVRLSLAFPQTTFFITHHHLMYMMEKLLTRAERRSFNALTSMPALLDWLEMHYCWTDWA